MSWCHSELQVCNNFEKENHRDRTVDICYDSVIYKYTLISKSLVYFKQYGVAAAQWLSQVSSDLIPASCCPHAETSLDMTLNPELALVLCHY